MAGDGDRLPRYVIGKIARRDELIADLKLEIAEDRIIKEATSDGQNENRKSPIANDSMTR